MHRTRIRVRPDLATDDDREELELLVSLQAKREDLLRELDDLCEEYHRLTVRTLSTCAKTHQLYRETSEMFWREVERIHPEVAKEPALAACLVEGVLTIVNDQEEACRQARDTTPARILAHAFCRAFGLPQGMIDAFARYFGEED